ncbi:MAG: hypothetical protein JKY37_04555 [Nannocystaceae bacterium]|nr:hypothetical protein [Nannocystaceae bacterium]
MPVGLIGLDRLSSTLLVGSVSAALLVCAGCSASDANDARETDASSISGTESGPSGEAGGTAEGTNNAGEGSTSRDGDSTGSTRPGPDTGGTTSGGEHNDSSSDADTGSDPPAVMPSDGCGRAAAVTGLQEDLEVTIGGETRTYDVFVPDHDGKTPVALVFTYHGVGGSPNTNRFNFDTMSSERGGTSIQVAPAGWASPEWDQAHFVLFSFDDSVEVFDQVLDSIAASYCIDLNRVFAMGHSNGGQMAFHLGCVRGDKLRAIMPSGGRCFSYGPGVCDPYNAPGNQQCVGEVMVLSVMGEQDVTRHADEQATVAGFRSRQGCDETTESRDPSPCVRFTGCNVDGEVASCRIPDLAHSIWADGHAGLYDYMMSL